MAVEMIAERVLDTCVFDIFKTLMNFGEGLTSLRSEYDRHLELDGPLA